jgi:hypothetical protein
MKGIELMPSTRSLTIIVLMAAMDWVAPAHAAVTISTAATQNINCSSGICTPTAANAVLNVNDLTTLLASSNVTVNTGAGSLGASVDDIVVAAGFNWASANALTLDAYRSVSFQNPVADNGSGAVSLVTNDGGSGGTLSFVSGGSLSFLGTTNNLSINGKTYALESSVAALATAIQTKSSGDYALSASYNANHDGAYKNAPIGTKFKGTFNGLGNTISNLTIKAKNKNEIGLFSYVEAPGTINSVRLTSANITANDNMEKKGSSAGIVAGANFGTVFNTFASGTMNVTDGKFDVIVGGLVGVSFGTILNSATTVTITISEGNSSPEAAVVGGLAGNNSGSITGSYSIGSISVTGTSMQGQVGGLVSFNNGPIENSYAEVSTTIPNTLYVGGLVGLTGSTVQNSYSAGAVTGGSGSYVGGFVGYDDQTGGSDVSNDYWDTTTSGITNLSQGAGNVSNDPGITGQTTAQLQSGLPAGFDPTIWAENPSINGGLPYLIANPPQ